MGEANRTQMNVRIAEDRKADWESFVAESPNVESLTHLVRVAVSSYVERERADGEAPRGEPVETGLEGDVKELHDRLQRLQGSVEDVGDKMEAMGRELDTAFRRPPLEVLFDVIPESEEDAKSASEISMDMGAPLQGIRSGLKQLHEENGRVKRSDHDVGAVYWKEVG